MTLNKSILIFLVIFIAALYGMLFTKLGNIFFKPFIEDYITHEIKYKIEITKLESKPGYIYFEGISPESKDIKINVLGNYSWFKGLFVLETYDNNKKLVKNYRY